MNTKNCLDLKGKREVFWDDYLIDTELTTAQHRLHKPIETDIVMKCDAPWEGNTCVYYSMFRENDGLIRLYYAAHDMKQREDGTLFFTDRLFCYAESRDNGLSWIKPNLGVREFNGSYDNNIVIDQSDVKGLDNFKVFRDDNPNCPPDEKYKATTAYRNEEEGKIQLWSFLSADGKSFRKGQMLIDGIGLDEWMAVEGLAFDTLNNAFWDEENQIYHCFVRGLHGRSTDGENCMIRDIRHLTSADFKNWTEPVLLDYKEKEEYPLYTNCISIYERAPQIMVGFPTRYMGREKWTANYDRLCGAENRRLKMESFEPRSGLVTTDSIFMCSRDGNSWTRYDEAFMTPGPERFDNWTYGSCYPAIGLFETPGKYGTESRLSMIASYNYEAGEYSNVMRYEIRKDGFVSLNAPYSGAKIVTKPFTFGGKGVAINFSTSARGYVYITLKSADGKTAKSCELFGDCCDRIVDFDTDLNEFADKETVMEITMRDADIYSVKFD